LSFQDPIRIEREEDAQLEKLKNENEAPPQRERFLCASVRKKEAEIMLRL
jgi:hypothetical protein